ncbi:Mov34/MPN/PAD-1 family protein [Cellvibrio sp. KY-YJ-3]|uniref:Mov34/MPN/PAD-1 family protein n=1 Tax=Cellvibrio sp. KY-YJ-3 TaxID=454662 RepID=UPI001CDA3C50|nr:Mov34/MPN/PAD-1 family protein [Cellvibrio sp. KY-YJ-3]
MTLRYELPLQWGIVEFSSEVLEHFEKFKQRHFCSLEAGGQLFFTLSKDSTVTKITDVTGPRDTDKRGRNKYVPDRAAEKVEISERYERNLHFIGDWHTHREKSPRPSPTDTTNIYDLVRLSDHDLPGFLMVIVGLSDFPFGLHVSFHSATMSYILSPLSD